MKNDYDADDAVAQEEEADGLRWMTVGVVLLVVIGFFALAWYAYQSTSQPSPEALETIHADAGPVKDKPKDPGGMNIPYQDMSVYNVISDGDKKDEAKVEQLLPDPEEPIAGRDTAPVTTAAPAEKDREVFIKDEAKDSGDPSSAAAEKGGTEEVAPAAPVVAKEAPVAKVVKTETIAPAVAAPESAPAEPKRFMEKAEAKPATPAAETAPAANGNVMVQLAALKSTAEAEKTWNQVQSRFPTPLSGKTHAIVKADLPSGTFYRLRVGGFSVDAAKKLCADLAAKKQPCMIVR